jgi:hypothetical protein
MIKALEIIWDAVLTFVLYAMLVAVFVTVMALSPAIVIVCACRDRVKVSEAFGDYMTSMFETFYEVVNKQ